MAGDAPIRNDTGIVPAKTPLSEDISAALKKRGFKFVGPVIVMRGCRRPVSSTIMCRRVIDGEDGGGSGSGEPAENISPAAPDCYGDEKMAKQSVVSLRTDIV